MRSSSSNDAAGAQALPAEDARILSVASGILGVEPDARYFEMLVRRAVEDMGADYAWVRLDSDGSADLIASTSCRAGAPAGPEGAASALQSRLADGASFECLDGMSGNHPWIAQAGVRACVARNLRDLNGAVCGHIAFAFKQAPASVSAYADVLAMLGAFAQHAVLPAMARKRELTHLRDVVAQYEALFQAAPVLINAFGPGGQCTLWNEACERRFGWSEAEVKAYQDPLALFYPDPHIRAQVIDSVGPQPSRAFREWHPCTRSGERLAVLWSNVRLPDGMVVNIGMDMTESRRTEAALARMARVDSLTGCWNRAEILKRVEDRLAGARRGEGGLNTALMLDLDYFKQVNDRYGHLGGDTALRHFCDQLRACVRDGDSIGRLGGEEFLVLLIDADMDVAHAICTRLRMSLRQHPVDIDGEAVALSVSGGIARFADGDASASDVLRRADFALYQAKRAGRDCAVEYRV
ncbi:GGDEF domain-containing protein [Achromobacter agilis]|uniref:diguanylate cyclase n=1 Tax=Achromobacter agilis TaxID=1353888 RepID=A0A446CGJ3_9BURK|nr:GGDEF domain-containing protein [Achromobacter agilis]SSW66941.1 putative diguanylate cyclase YdaM [Achromobacter agilis]